ncbi:3-oxo-5-alpha-steroid 4-dehydrogenase 2 [Zea mays]|jgi:hypothetical protein|uniref:3-oxo-5-alpha-steroid 4-dehydrogenase family protein n=1 Tax=Zea mays TaxID=4577 RepID=A0A1D6F9X1_MAIZE|nr:3-oxo-5-alpha-steroid 4-dehydrogenase 2 [Zea mays]ONM27909.1 3-oxo-5-alpha-steroid 4-dehydrogenase family protein [Zea mays]|eukprot:XP_008671971.1 3-oxo-5-alpha-steroid 4-dehydrogenase 2 [Zea mays]
MAWPAPPFLHAPSPLEAWASAAGAVAMAFLAVSEFRGDHLAYSKFSRGGGGGGGGGQQGTKQQQQRQRVRVPSRIGMVLLYFPALAAAVASFAVPGAVDGARAHVLSAAIAVHFLKRVLEALFLHRYSGSMPLATSLLIAGHYLFAGGGMIYAQRLRRRGLPEPRVDLLLPGVLAFAVGLAGNFYHHYLLSRLRARHGGDAGGEGAYRIPSGGLFGLVACPHYLFETLAFFGLAMVSQTLFALTVAVGTAAYLAGRSRATRKWYAAKFDDFPSRVKALVPYVW